MVKFLIMLEHSVPLSYTPNPSLQRSTTKHNLELLNDYLRCEHWEELQLHPTTNLKYELFINRLIDYVNLACPYKVYKRTNKKVANGWITKGIQVSRKNIKLYYKLLPYSQDNNFHNYYKRYKTIYRRVIKAAKSLHINRKLKRSNCVSKTAWNLVNDLKNNYNKPPIEIEKEGVLLSDPEVVANEFNTYFSSILQIM